MEGNDSAEMIQRGLAQAAPCRIRRPHSASDAERIPKHGDRAASDEPPPSTTIAPKTGLAKATSADVRGHLTEPP